MARRVGSASAWTRAHLDARGLSAGWRCWEVGAGGPNTVRWLAERVGPTGHVLATDLDPRWAAAAIGANVSVLAHDVTEAPPEGGFDLIHARLVLTHVPERERALRNLAGALRPVVGWWSKTPTLTCYPQLPRRPRRGSRAG